jgi:hypothetical protein
VASDATRKRLSAMNALYHSVTRSFGAPEFRQFIQGETQVDDGGIQID